MPADATDDAFLTCSFYDSDRDSNLTFSHMTRYPLGSLKILRWLANSIVHMIRQEDQGHPEFISVRLASMTALQIHAVRLLGKGIHESESGDLDRAIRQSTY